MKSGTCPKCHATDVRITSAYQFDTYVCPACGYFEHYVAEPRTKLAAAAAKWPAVSP